jgi:hypothetical protein
LAARPGPARESASTERSAPRGRDVIVSSSIGARHARRQHSTPARPETGRTPPDLASVPDVLLDFRAPYPLCVGCQGAICRNLPVPDHPGGDHHRRGDDPPVDPRLAVGGVRKTYGKACSASDRSGNEPTSASRSAQIPPASNLLMPVSAPSAGPGHRPCRWRRADVPAATKERAGPQSRSAASDPRPWS